MKIRYFVGIMMAIFAVSCTSSKKMNTSVEKPDQLDNQRWNLVQLQGDTITPGVKGFPFLRFDSTMQVSGNAGCNILNGRFSLENKDEIKFGPLATTRMYCPDSDSLERTFLNVLGKVDRYSISDTQLSLYSGDEQVARLEAGLPESLTGQWKLFYITGRKIAFDGLYPDRKPALIFDPAQRNVVSGNNGCNTFRNEIKVVKDEFKLLEPGMMTLMACPGEGDKVFSNMLRKVTRYTIESDTLTLYLGKTPAMRFQKINNP